MPSGKFDGLSKLGVGAYASVELRWDGPMGASCITLYYYYMVVDRERWGGPGARCITWDYNYMVVDQQKYGWPRARQPCNKNLGVHRKQVCMHTCIQTGMPGW